MKNRETRGYLFQRYLLLLIIAGVMGLNTASAAITASPAATSLTNSGTSKTVSFTNTAASNQIMIVSVVTNDPNAWITSAKYGTVNLAKKDSVTNASGTKAYVFYLLNPANGTANVSVSFNTSVYSIVGVNTFSGVDMATPFGNSNQQTTAGNVSINVSGTNANQLVYLLAGFNSNGTITFGAGQTELSKAASSFSSLGTSYKTGSAGTTSVSTTQLSCLECCLCICIESRGYL